MERLMRVIMLIAAATLMVACGTDAPVVGNPDSSMVTPSDGGNPTEAAVTPDASTPADASADASVPPTDVPSPTDNPTPPVDAGDPMDASTPPTDAPPRDVDMLIAGVGRMFMSGPFLCDAVMCNGVTVNYNGRTESEPRRIRCGTERPVTEANLEDIGFGGDGIAECRGNTCFQMRGTMMHAIVYPMDGTVCQPCGHVIDVGMRTMMRMPAMPDAIVQACSA